MNVTQLERDIVTKALEREGLGSLKPSDFSVASWIEQAMKDVDPCKCGVCQEIRKLFKELSAPVSLEETLRETYNLLKRLGFKRTASHRKWASAAEDLMARQEAYIAVSQAMTDKLWEDASK